MKRETKVKSLIVAGGTVTAAGAITLAILLAGAWFSFLPILGAVAILIFLGLYSIKYRFKLTWRQAWNGYWGIKEAKKDE